MNCRLRNTERVISGGYSYQQTGDKPRNFPGQPMLIVTARQVFDYRRANNLPDATLEQCIIDTDRFNARRLGCDPRLTVAVDSEDSTDSVLLAPNSPNVSRCAGCGASVS